LNRSAPPQPCRLYLPNTRNRWATRVQLPLVFKVFPPCMFLARLQDGHRAFVCKSVFAFYGFLLAFFSLSSPRFSSGEWELFVQDAWLDFFWAVLRMVRSRRRVGPPVFFFCFLWPPRPTPCSTALPRGRFPPRHRFKKLRLRRFVHCSVALLRSFPP